MKKIIQTKNAPAAIGPYSQAILAGNTLYCSGQIAINPVSGKLITDDISKETVQVMENIYALLKSVDMNFSNIVKCSIFMKDINNYNKINEEYAKFFEHDPPAREAVQVSKLPKDVNLEISVIAIK